LERFGRDLLLLERLAAGGMAEVYRAKRTGHGGFEKIVAVKRILQSYAENEEFKEMFRHEAILCAQLQHPNIVQVFSNGEHDEYLFLVMEYVNGKNVRQLLAKVDRLKQRIPIEIACYLVKESAKGLDFAHNFKDEATGQDLEVVHRDMSPQNIMIGYDGTVKIVDFGIAKAAARSDTTKAGVLKGKFGYMSPEQAQGLKLDRRSDVFSLGIILWELLTQRRLFSTDDDMKTLQLVRDCKIMKPSRKNPSVPYGLDKIVLKALSKDRSERYANAGEMYKDLTRYLAEKHPEFIDTDFSIYMQKVFEENIIKEKEKRDKLALEAPAILAPSESERQKPIASSGKGDATFVEDLDKTEVSRPGADVEDLLADHQGATNLEFLIDSPDKTGPIDHELRELTMSGIEGAAKSTNSGDLDELPLADLSDDLEGASGKQNSKLSLTNTNFSEHVKTNVTAISEAASTKKPKKKSNLKRVALLCAALFLILAGISEKFGSPKKEVSSDVAKALPTKQDVNPVEQQVVEEPSEVSQGEDVEDPVEVSDEGSDPALRDPEPIAQQPVQPGSEAIGAEKAAGRSVSNIDQIKPLQRDPAAVLPGQIELHSLPRANTVYINGVKIIGADGDPMSTPMKGIALDAGIYKIRLENSALGASWEGQVKIKSERLFKKSVLLISPQ